MFKNEKIKEIHITRYVMSWVRSGGKLNSRGDGYDEFNDWLRTLELSKEERDSILEVARSGKIELEISAKTFLKGIRTDK